MKKRVHKVFAITAAVILMLGTTVTASTSYSLTIRQIGISYSYLLGTGFTRTRSSSSGNGYYTGTVSASVSTLGSSDHYISASSSHTIDSLRIVYTYQ